MKILKELRLQNRYTQEDVSKFLNVTQSSVAAWEVGKTTPSLANLRDLALLFDVTIDFLLDPDAHLEGANFSHLLDSKTKDRAFRVLELYGLTPQKAVQLFFNQIAQTGQLPITFNWQRGSQHD